MIYEKKQQQQQTTDKEYISMRVRSSVFLCNSSEIWDSLIDEIKSRWYWLFRSHKNHKTRNSQTVGKMKLSQNGTRKWSWTCSFHATWWLKILSFHTGMVSGVEQRPSHTLLCFTFKKSNELNRWPFNQWIYLNWIDHLICVEFNDNK